MPTHDPVKLKALLETCACDSDIERTCRDNWPNDTGSWCGGCQILAVGDAWQAERERAERLEAQLPTGMKTCTILFRSCEKGHGWLTATNWVEFECPICRAERLERENERLREARADVVSWVPMLRYLRDALHKGAENIDAALVAIEHDPDPNCPTCGQPLGGSFPTCAGCQLVEALKRGE